MLLAINDEVVVNKTHESILLLYQDVSFLPRLNPQVIPPVSLLLSCPYQFCLISPLEISSFLSHASSVSVSPSIPSLLDGSPSDASPQPFAVDAFMFPHSQGYAILEKQWETFPFSSSLTSSAHATQSENSSRMWDSFLRRIGGVEKLRFAWTRQSGVSWSLGLSSDARHRRQLRALMRSGVGLCVSLDAGAERVALRCVVSSEWRLRAAQSLGE